MLGVFELSLPSGLTQKLSQPSTKKGFLSAYVIGTVAGVVASPCVGPVLVSILAYVTKSQELLFGFGLLFVFALGMGQIFLLLGTFSQLVHKLPRSGNWMNATKYIFALIMMMMAIYYPQPTPLPTCF